MDTVKAAASFLHFSSAQLVCVGGSIESVWPRVSFADIPLSNLTVKHRYPPPHLPRRSETAQNTVFL